MPTYMGGDGCTGTLAGIFSGSLPVSQTGSYFNTDSGTTACTGSLLVSDYTSGSTTFQRVHAYLGNAEEGDPIWTQLGGQPGAYTEDNTAAISNTVTTTIYRPGSTIFVDPGQAATHVAYTLEAADTAGAGTEYTIVSTANANGATEFGITGSSGEIQVLFQGGNGAANNTGNTWFRFNAGVITQGTRITCRCDSNSWYLDVSTDKDTDEVAYSG